ncbi:hypothetical protein [Agrococcus casei]|uniref:hypothetical protein n=1 Tax=Agrococcus casei TaxID=343512 RepID=UPI003F90F04D
MMQITTLELPDTADEQSHRGDFFRAAVELVARCNEAVYGAASPVLNSRFALTMRQGTSAEAVTTLVAADDGRVLGLADLFLPQTESTHTSDTMLFVDPSLDAARRAEVCEQLVDASVEHAKGIGRAIVLGGGEAAADGEVMAETGFGGVSRSDPESAAWLRRGAALSQVYRSSWLRLDRLESLQSQIDAAAASAAGYRSLVWTGETPPRHRPDMRHLHERMSTDSPTGSLELEAQTWSDARLAEFERHKIGGGRTLLTAAAEHIESGELVGYTQMLIAEDGLARQHNLIVLREHRGHRLGMLIKLAGLDQLIREAPHATAVTTMNAEENRHMLRVNEQVGFETVAHLAVFQLRLGS